MTIITDSHLTTAACLWEAALDYLNQTYKKPGGFAERLALYREQHGTAQVRDDVARLAVACDDAWEALTPDEQDDGGAFDWEFCPDWLAENFFDRIGGY